MTVRQKRTIRDVTLSKVSILYGLCKLSGDASMCSVQAELPRLHCRSDYLFSVCDDALKINLLCRAVRHWGVHLQYKITPSGTTAEGCERRHATPPDASITYKVPTTVSNSMHASYDTSFIPIQAQPLKILGSPEPCSYNLRSTNRWLSNISSAVRSGSGPKIDYFSRWT